MRFLFLLVSLTMFAHVAAGMLPPLLEPLFAATAGEPFVLSVLLCAAVLAAVALGWTWSARRHVHP